VSERDRSKAVVAVVGVLAIAAVELLAYRLAGGSGGGPAPTAAATTVTTAAPIAQPELANGRAVQIDEPVGFRFIAPQTWVVARTFPTVQPGSEVAGGDAALAARVDAITQRFPGAVVVAIDPALAEDMEPEAVVTVNLRPRPAEQSARDLAEADAATYAGQGYRSDPVAVLEGGLVELRSVPTDGSSGVAVSFYRTSSGVAVVFASFIADEAADAPLIEAMARSLVFDS
jgi:hypothetical protein